MYTKTSARRRTVARFVKLLGACSVPDVAIGSKSPQKMWAAASAYERQWLVDRFCPLRIKEQGYGRGSCECWCDKGVTTARKNAVFAGFARFRRTGKIWSAV